MHVNVIKHNTALILRELKHNCVILHP